jgi:hypothetical protein
MGLHGGFIVAQREWPDMHGALVRHCGPLLDQGPVPRALFSHVRDGHSPFLHAASHDGNCYVLDPQMMLSLNSDLIRTLSLDLACPVIGAGSEALSGTFYLTAAHKGRLVRLHYHQKASITEPFDLGNPWDCESFTPFDEPEGLGILLGVRAGGFDVDVLLHGPAEGGFRYRLAAEQMPATGELVRRISGHARMHLLPHAVSDLRIS